MTTRVATLLGIRPALWIRTAMLAASGTLLYFSTAHPRPPNPPTPFEFSEMLQACLAVRSCISFTAWGFGDADSWVPGFFTGEGIATLYDVNLNPKTAYTALQEDLTLAARGAPQRPETSAH
jgi:endo-1,4-beta-xylanase